MTATTSEASPAMSVASATLPGSPLQPQPPPQQQPPDRSQPDVENSGNGNNADNNDKNNKCRCKKDRIIVGIDFGYAPSTPNLQ